MASNESYNSTRHMTNDSLTTKHVAENLTTKHTSDLFQRTQTTAHIHNRLGGTEQAPTQNQGSPAPANSNNASSGSGSGQGSSGSTE
jgi:hypothetical protein